MDAEELAAIKGIERTLELRWWIFAIMIVIIVVSAYGAFANLSAIKRIEAITLVADSRSLKNEILIDAAMKQQIVYQQQLAQYMDKLSHDNPKVKVPRVLVRPPPTLNALLSDEELTRTTTPTLSKTTPKADARHKLKPKPAPKPTPKPWFQFFKTTK
jgi:hypothetical protein